ncbi:MAG: penicillin-binding protein 2 [Thermoanaerobacterales bacterium]|nr:penicillin-binding protein 2 [Thermoanaerobacterales bacterium]
MGRSHPRRVRSLFLALLACFGLLIWRLGVIQVAQHDLYAGARLEQGTAAVPLESEPRGRILDRNLAPLAGGVPEECVVIIPALMKDADHVVRRLAAVLGRPVSEVRSQMGKPGALPYSLSPSQRRALAAHQWEGVYVLPVTVRYPTPSLAAHVLGFTGPVAGRDEIAALSRAGSKSYGLGDRVGKAGLELAYEQDLKGSRPARTARVFVDARGRPLQGLGLVVTEGAPDGRHDLVLTLDRRVQAAVEEVLDRHGVRGAAAVLDVGNGDLLAVASRPGFDPRAPGKAAKKDGDPFVNRALALYQPGSVFKLVVAAAALEEGLVTPESVFRCEGRSEQLIPCWNGAGHGELTFGRAFAESCNPTFAKVALRLGAERLAAFSRRLGLEDDGIIGLPVKHDPRQDLSAIARPYNLVNASIGQGPVLLNAVQAAGLAATFANGGTYFRPRLVAEVRSGGKVLRRLPPDQGRPAVSSGTAAAMRRLMTLVTTEGNGRSAWVPGWGSAGKTGTAELGDGCTNAWFVGYTPLARPRYAIAVFIEGGVSGGEAAGPVFREIADRLLACAPKPGARAGDGLSTQVPLL